ncbi:MAG: VWA containing CoxE family protein [Lachnospiraceae bacterium]|nr:VWA containing CoxE family protein [Lachnospiraceae bacterium]
MFSPFFYILKAKGLEVSTTEWLTLMNALDKGLCGASLTQFYYVARMILVKSEADYDRFDVAFEEYFKDFKAYADIPDAIRKFLEKPDMPQDHTNDELFKPRSEELSKEEIEGMFEERKTEQKTEHNGGSYWIGTNGTSTFGHNGKQPGGIRIGGQSALKSAFQVVGDRRFADFRRDKALNIRQFQVAFRRLRQFSSKIDAPKSELDLDGTIDSTCNNGGYLKLEFEKPRKNTVKLLLLFDSGGTMMPFSTLCNNLFQAVHKANHFKDVKTYYFHNCIYAHVYNSPECDYGDWVESEWLFKNLDADYKVIIVGDAQMAPEELFHNTGNYRGPNNGLSGYEWLTWYTKKFKKVVWLNPRYHANVAKLDWLEAEQSIAGLIKMFPLSVDGLKYAIEELMSTKR